MVHITDVLAVSMMLGITAQVKEAGIAWDKGEKKSKDRTRLGGSGSRSETVGRRPGAVVLTAAGLELAPERCPLPGAAVQACQEQPCSSLPDLEVLRSFQNQIAAIQRDAVWWLHTVVPSISKLAPKDYVHWYSLCCAAQMAMGRDRQRLPGLTRDTRQGWPCRSLSPWTWPQAGTSLRGAVDSSHSSCHCQGHCACCQARTALRQMGRRGPVCLGWGLCEHPVTCQPHRPCRVC